MSDDEFSVIVDRWDTIIADVIEAAHQVRMQLNDLEIEGQLQDDVERQLERVRYDMGKVIDPRVGKLAELIAGYVNQNALLREARTQAECDVAIAEAQRKARVSMETAQTTVTIVRSQMADCERKAAQLIADREATFEQRVADEVQRRLYGPIPEIASHPRRAVVL